MSKDKEEKKMTAFADFLALNRDKIRKVTKLNSKRNKDGLEVISRDDEWFKEKEWEDYYKGTNDKK
jgi:aspartyl aminopeptidase